MKQPNQPTKHTQGPWKPAARFESNLCITSEQRGNVCKVLLWDASIESLEQAKADAALISAAPEMYALLHALWSKMDPASPDCRKLSQLLDAIDNKAKGVTNE